MIFRRQPRSSRSAHRSSKHAFQFRPLLRVLEPHQRPEDFEDPIERSFAEPDVVISRAELDLRRSVQRLTLQTSAAIHSLDVLTALQLPQDTAALLWTARMLLKNELPKEDDKAHHIQNQNHDARLLYQALRNIDLDRWYASLVDKATLGNLPNGLQFPPGHPVDQRYYRQHPLPVKQQFYLPVASYFANLMEERKQELIQLMIVLGATKITISSLSQASSLPPETLHFPGKRLVPGVKVNTRQFAWFPYEPQWQRLVTMRSAGAAEQASVDLTLDVNGMLVQQGKALAQITTQLDSVKTFSTDSFYRQFLNPQRIEATFFEIADRS